MKMAVDNTLTWKNKGVPEISDDPADAKLIELVRMGDKAAFALLVRRHNIRFYRLAYRFMANAHDAEDIVQEAFLKIWHKPFLWQEDKNTAFTTWFYRVIVNMCLDHKKKKRPSALTDDMIIADDRETSEALLLAKEKQMFLETQIADLPERQRVALNLCFYEELSNQEAADIMGLGIKALQSLVMRAKTTLRMKVQERLGN